jgi:hypothetical protein
MLNCEGKGPHRGATRTLTLLATATGKGSRRGTRPRDVLRLRLGKFCESCLQAVKIELTGAALLEARGPGRSG